MASYNTVITNEGAALLASVIANQGTLTFSEMRFSTTDYDGVEATLTVGTFAGVFITAAASASVVDSTTIKVDAQFDNSGIVGDHPLYSIGIVGTDGNTTALIAVCTTTNPDIIRAALTGVSTYAFNVNLAVSSTSDITVTGTTAAVLYDTDTVDNLNSTDATKPLSANMGHTLGEEVNAIVNVYGSKNLLPRMQGGTHTSNTVVFTFNDDGSITANGTATGGNATCFRFFDTLPKAGIAYTLTGGTAAGKGTWVDAYNNGVYVRTIGWSAPDADTFTPDYVGYNQLMWGVYIESGKTCTNETFYPMLRDARIVDDTYEPYVPTNRQLLSHYDNGVLGAKNLCPTILSGVDGSVTFTTGADGSVTVNGSPSGAYAYKGADITNIVKAGQAYKVTGGHAVGKHIVISASDANWVFVRDICVDNGDGATFSPDFSDYVHLYMSIIILNGQTCTNEVFYPMLRLASDTDETYQPFAMTNKQLTDAVYKKFIPVENISFTAYADGVKTLSTLVDDVMTQLQIWINNNPNMAFQFNFLFLEGVSARPTDGMIRDAVTILGFTQIGVGLPNFYMRYIVAQSSGSQIYLANGTFTATDESSAIAGSNVVLYIIAFEKT